MPSVGYLFRALWLVWLVVWLISARGTKRTASRARLRSQLVWLLLILCFAVAVHLQPLYFARRILPPDDARAYACLAAAALGFAFAVWARRTLGANWSSTPVIKEDHELIRGGPYRLVRHPIYTGFLVAIAGTCVADGRVLDAYILLVGAITLFWKLRVEESLMMQQFPEAYPEYRKQTKALIPFVL